MSSTGAGLLNRTEAGEFVYDEPKAEVHVSAQPERALVEDWSLPDPVDELLIQLKSLGRRVEAEQIEATLRDFDALHNGPIVLGVAASARLDEIMSTHAGPLPESPPPLDAFPSE